MSLRLITETTHDVKTLSESVDGGRTYFIEGIFMQGNVKNQNGRIYPTGVLARESVRYTRESIAKKRALGELGHPDGPTINLDRVSHMITELAQDGDNFVGRAKVMTETPMGKIVKNLIDEGVELAVSTRGLGSLRETGNGMEVQDDFYLSTVDIVADPSAPDAFVRGIMEGKAWVWEGGALKEQVLEQVAAVIENAHKPTTPSDVRQQTFVEAYTQFLEALRTGVKVNV